MEWITALINTVVVIGLVGLLWRNQAKKVDEKQDVKLCDEKHSHINENLADIKQTSDDNNRKLGRLITDVALLAKAVNSG